MSSLEGSRKLGALTLRPFSFGTLEACEKLNLTLFTQSSSADTMDAGELRRQMVSFAWVQTESPEKIVEAFTSGTAEKQIRLFQFSLGLEQLDELVREVTRIASAIKSVAVEVVEKPHRGSSDTPPPN